MALPFKNKIHLTRTCHGPRQPKTDELKEAVLPKADVPKALEGGKEGEKKPVRICFRSNTHTHHLQLLQPQGEPFTHELASQTRFWM